MPFGLHSAPATFQRLLDKVLGPDLKPHVFVYLDDIIIIIIARSQNIWIHYEKSSGAFVKPSYA